MGQKLREPTALQTPPSVPGSTGGGHFLAHYTWQRDGRSPRPLQRNLDSVTGCEGTLLPRDGGFRAVWGKCSSLPQQDRRRRRRKESKRQGRKGAARHLGPLTAEESSEEREVTTSTHPLWKGCSNDAFQLGGEALAVMLLVGCT